MEFIIPLANYLKEMKNRNEDSNDANESNSNYSLNNNHEVRKNQRNNNIFDFGCLNSVNNTNNNSNNNNNNDSLKLITQLLMPNLLNSSSQNNNFFQGTNNDFLKTSNLITELIDLEQQNRMQIELIQKIIENKYKNNSFVNGLLCNLLTGVINDKHEIDITTKTSTKSNEVNSENKNNTISNLDDKNKKETPTLLNKKTLRDPKTNNVCGHLEKKHYAKGMCNNCYHSNGRNKKAWKCSHVNKTHYALGVCQNCYQSKYTSKAKKQLEENTHSSQYEENVESKSNDVIVEKEEIKEEIAL